MHRKLFGQCGLLCYTRTMQVITAEQGRYLLRFDRGEEVIAALAAFAAREHIGGAAFSAIGAAEKIVISFYHGRLKQYEDMVIKDELEIASLSGNIAWKEGEVVVHAHGLFSDRNMKSFGGHVKKCVVSFACEVSVSVFSKKIERAHDTVTGLNLLK